MIEINNLTAIEIDGKFLKKIAEKVLKGENKNGLDLSIALVGEGRIKGLNKKYLGKNRITDILSFSYDSSGEIVICLREVKKNARRFGSAFEKELAKVLIHGILHLLKYEHEGSELTAKNMEAKQERYLKSFFK